MNGDNKKSPFWKRDRLFWGILLQLTVCVTVVCYLISRQGGNRVVVTIDGTDYGSYSLNEDQTITIETEYGRNVFSIREGRVVMDMADCPDGICTKHDAISGLHETIVCLPNKFVLTIDGKKSIVSTEIDGVAQ